MNGGRGAGQTGKRLPRAESPVERRKVLFLCTRNTARSQMAEAFLRHYAGDRFEPHSAGLDPDAISPCAQRVMEEIGFHMSRQYSKHVSEYMGKVHFGYCIMVCDSAEPRCPTTFPDVSQILHWSVEDPVAFVGSDEEKLQKFREVRDQIDQRIRAWLAEQGI